MIFFCSCSKDENSLNLVGTKWRTTEPKSDHYELEFTGKTQCVVNWEWFLTPGKWMVKDTGSYILVENELTITWTERVSANHAVVNGNKLILYDYINGDMTFTKQ